MRLPICFVVSFLSLAGASVAQETPAASDVLFILDGSGSMWGRVNDVEKIVVAKDVMAGLIEGLPEGIDTGLITYGHRARGACDDIEVIASPGVTSRSDLLGALAGITPLGKTPIADSLLQAGEVLRETEEAVSVVLVSDGIESCEGDPCATAAQLRQQGIDVKIHVVGFDVDAEAQEQLSCIAEAGGGEYYQAGSADALSAALADVRVSIVEPVVEEPEPEPFVQTLVITDTNISLAEDVIGGVNVVDEASDEVLLRLAGTKLEQVPPGSYQFAFDNYLSPAIAIEAGEEYVISAAQFGLSTIQLDGTQQMNVDVVDTQTGQTLTYLSGTSSQLFAAGSYQFVFANFTSPPVTIDANETYVISPSDYALAQIAMDGTQIMSVGVVDDVTDEKVTSLSGTTPKNISPGIYRFKFSNFTSPPFVVEGNGEYTISPSDYGLSTVVMDGSQIGGVNVVDDATDETLTRLSGTTPKLIPPGSYRFGFDYFESPVFIVEPNQSYTISSADYGLSQVAMDGNQIGGVNAIDDLTGDTLVRLSGTSAKQIPPGSYRFGFDHYETETFVVETGQSYTISPADYGLATVSKVGDLSGGLEFVKNGERVVTLLGSGPKQIPPGDYTLVNNRVELTTVTIAPAEVRVFEFE